MKNYYIQQNIGKAKYVVNFHDGVKKYDDGSNFYDLRIFKSRKAMNTFISSLKDEGYIEKYGV